MPAWLALPGDPAGGQVILTRLRGLSWSRYISSQADSPGVLQPAGSLGLNSACSSQEGLLGDSHLPAAIKVCSGPLKHAQ